MEAEPRRAILVFVKYPEPGLVKTRLAATAGPEQAAEIYRWMVAEVAARLPQDAEAIACYDPPQRRAEIEPWLRSLAGFADARFLPQADGGLGRRLERAFAEAFALGFTQVAAIGTDCLEIDAALFHAAWATLATHEVVLGPSEDGGYYLIALAAPQPALFQDIPWSTDVVLRETLARAAAANLRVHQLAMRFDVDTEEDWRRAQRRLESGASRDI